MDEKKIEDFARWLEQQRKEASYYTPDGIAREAARRFGVSYEDKAVLDMAKKWREMANLNPQKYREGYHKCWRGPEDASLAEAVDASRKAQEPKPRFEKFELGIMDRETNEYISLFDETGREKLLALLNQAHETERG